MHFTEKGRTACGLRVKRSQLFQPWFSYCCILRGDTPSKEPLSWIRNGYQGTRGWGILHWLSSCPGGGSSNTPSSCVVWKPIWSLVSCGHWAPAIESTQVICALRALDTFLRNKGFFYDCTVHCNQHKVLHKILHKWSNIMSNKWLQHAYWVRMPVSQSQTVQKGEIWVLTVNFCTAHNTSP